MAQRGEHRTRTATKRTASYDRWGRRGTLGKLLANCRGPGAAAGLIGQAAALGVSFEAEAGQEAVGGQAGPVAHRLAGQPGGASPGGDGVASGPTHVGPHRSRNPRPPRVSGGCGTLRHLALSCPASHWTGAKVWRCWRPVQRRSAMRRGVQADGLALSKCSNAERLVPDAWRHQHGCPHAGGKGKVPGSITEAPRTGCGGPSKFKPTQKGSPLRGCYPELSVEDGL